MRLFTFLRFAILFSIVLLITYLYSIGKLRLDSSKLKTKSPISKPTFPLPITLRESQRNDIVVAAVACGDRLHETLTMIKSALMFTRSSITFIILCEDALIESFNQKLSEWQDIHNNFKYTVMGLIFPAKDGDEWKKLFKPCAAQRLFLPDILSDIDSLVYVDTDTLFLTPVETIWAHFRKMNSSQMAALAPEHEDPNVAWYNRFARHPYYGQLGVNSGVMLMNLTRMRAFQWSAYVSPIYRKYKLKITWGDQDIINIIFHYHPGKLLLYSCRYNFRPDHCMYMSVCKAAEREGVAVVHGSRGFFHSEKQPVFQAIYKAFEEYRLGGDLSKDFYQPLQVYLNESGNTNCGHIKEVFLKNMKRFIDPN